MRRRVWMMGITALVAAGVVVSACGEPPETPAGLPDVVSCERWLEEPVRAEWVANGCELDGTIYLAMTRECSDGTELFYNDVATGKVGEPAVTIAPEETVPQLPCPG